MKSEIIICLAIMVYFVNSLPLHCSHTNVLKSDSLSSYSINQAAATALQTRLFFGDTFCVIGRTSDNATDVLYTVTFNEMLSIHTVTSNYTFGVPVLKSTCQCYCPPTMSGELLRTTPFSCHSSTSFNDGTTVHVGQSANGCPSPMSSSSMCCRVEATPYRNWKIQALTVGEPESIVTIGVSTWVRVNDDWEQLSKENMRMNIREGRGRNFTDGTITVTTVQNSALSTGRQYIKLPNSSSLRTSLSLNHVNEQNTANVGWLRYTSVKGWHAFNDHLPEHSVRVTNCRQQLYVERYTSACYFNANQHYNEQETTDVLDGCFPESVDALMRPDSTKIHVDVENRRVVVNHKRPSPIDIQMFFTRPLNASLLHGVSHLGDFSASLHVDSNARFYLNITLDSSEGTMIGSLNVEDEVDEEVFTFDNVDEHRYHLKIITSFESIPNSATLCIHALGLLSTSQICRPINTIISPTDSTSISHSWFNRHGDCPRCNQFVSIAGGISIFDDLNMYIHPIDYMNSDAPIVDKVTFAVKCVLMMAVLLLVFAIMRRCVWPLINWSVCKGGKKRRREAPFEKDHV